MWTKGKIRIGRSCLQKYSLEEHNQSARSPCRTNLTRLGHSDSYTGVKQSTLMRRPLTTSGQGRHKECICIPFIHKFFGQDGLYRYKL